MSAGVCVCVCVTISCNVCVCLSVPYVCVCVCVSSVKFHGLFNAGQDSVCRAPMPLSVDSKAFKRPLILHVSDIALAAIKTNQNYDLRLASVSEVLYDSIFV